MTVITKPLSQQEKNEKQSGKDSCMYEVSLSDPVKPSDSGGEVAQKKVYSICYTRGRKTESSNIWIVLAIMVISCVILAILGYYQLNCLRKKGEENIRKRQETLQQLQKISQPKWRSKFQTLHGLTNEMETFDDTTAPTQKLEASTVAISTMKYHRGTCRVPCHAQKTFKQLCPKRSIQTKSSHGKKVTTEKPRTKSIDFLLGGIGGLQGTKEEQDLVHNQVLIQNTKEVQKDNFGEDGTFELTYELDLDQETFELIQMPEISSGMYLHDFTANRTVIIEPSRCFVMAMDRNEIAPPRTFFDLILNWEKNGYQLNLNEIQHDMQIVLPELNSDEALKKYGMIIGSFCKNKSVYRLEPVPEEMAAAQKLQKEMEIDIFASFSSLGDFKRRKRSTTTKDKKMFKELSKFSISYNIVNYHVL